MGSEDGTIGRAGAAGGTAGPAARPAPLVVVSGPSGVGKTTVVEELIKAKSLPLRRAITATTRPKRAGEVDEVSYHFWTRERFEEEVAKERMFEYATVFGTDYYGTPRSEVEDHRAAGCGVILVIDVQGAARVRELAGRDCLSVFIRPPNFEELEARLRGRGDLTEDRIRRRLQTAREELDRAGEFDHEIINADLGTAVRELEALIRERFDTGGSTCSTS
jgi:guanylate kinase